MMGSKYYVVWKGRKTGIFSSWQECERQVKGFTSAEFKAFETLAEAKAALGAGYDKHRGKAASQGRWKLMDGGPRVPSISVDAACAGSPGPLEFRGVDTESGRQLFHAGPLAGGTNNVGEFLAIVQALRWLRQNGKSLPVYSDSQNAIGWIRDGKCRTKLKRSAANRKVFEMIAEGEAELQELFSSGGPGGAKPNLLKWDTIRWGEIPADYGRK